MEPDGRPRFPPEDPLLGAGITDPPFDPRELVEGGAEGREVTVDRPALGGELIEGREEAPPPDEMGAPRLPPPDETGAPRLAPPDWTGEPRLAPPKEPDGVEPPRLEPR